MKIPAIKKLVELYTIEQLAAAEAAIENGEPLAIEVEGEDEGEQLTHTFAAKWIKEQVAEGKEFNAALREFSQKVRTSIS